MRTPKDGGYGLRPSERRLSGVEFSAVAMPNKIGMVRFSEDGGGWTLTVLANCGEALYHCKLW